MIDDIKWATRQRLSFIEVRAYYCCLISRSDLASAFGISDAAATKDLKLYNDLAAGNLTYQQASFGFVPTRQFSAYFADLAPAKALQMVAMNLNSIEGPYRDDPLYQVPTSALPIPLRLPDKAVLAAITRAIFHHKRLLVSYHSLSDNTSESKRIIEPHTLVNSGSRWHVRAYNSDSFDFRDFVLSRFGAAEVLDEPAESSAQYDEDWQAVVTVRLGVHPRLDTRRAETVLLDYGMEDGELQIPVRLALVNYLLVQLAVDLSEDHHQSATQYPFVLLNRDEIGEYFW